jgi:TM2 domain-containing membrane protein YozV
MKNSGLAAVLSFLVPGLGQVYNGHIGKGISFFIGYGIAWATAIIVIGFILAPAVWIWSMVDAYKSAEKINMTQVNKAV